MKQPLILLATILCSLSLGMGDASAKGKGNSKGKGKGNSSAVSKGKHGKGSPADKHPGKGASKDKGGKAKKPKDKGPKGKGPDFKHADHWRIDGKFRDEDRKGMVSHWGRYQGHPHGLPPGLAKNLRRGKGLPPGWEKKLHSGWVVEDDWWGHFSRVTSDHLPRDLKMPAQTGMYLFGDRLVRVHEPTREVIDLVRVPTVKR